MAVGSPVGEVVTIGSPIGEVMTIESPVGELVAVGSPIGELVAVESPIYRRASGGIGSPIGELVAVGSPIGELVAVDPLLVVMVVTISLLGILVTVVSWPLLGVPTSVVILLRVLSVEVDSILEVLIINRSGSTATKSIYKSHCKKYLPLLS